ncbi:hypothetical protein [Sphingomonas lycopersici]|uniref:hypothetical protein n=1 Tax=Sphingomonas lycopersici TaxID=2951807 RepID=UPI003D799B9F
MAVMDGLLARLVDSRQRFGGGARVRLRLERHAHELHRRIKVRTDVYDGALRQIRVDRIKANHLSRERCRYMLYVAALGRIHRSVQFRERVAEIGAIARCGQDARGGEARQVSVPHIRLDLKDGHRLRNGATIRELHFDLQRRLLFIIHFGLAIRRRGHRRRHLCRTSPFTCCRAAPPHPLYKGVVVRQI